MNLSFRISNFHFPNRATVSFRIGDFSLVSESGLLVSESGFVRELCRAKPGTLNGLP